MIVFWSLWALHEDFFLNSKWSSKEVNVGNIWKLSIAVVEKKFQPYILVIWRKKKIKHEYTHLYHYIKNQQTAHIVLGDVMLESTEDSGDITRVMIPSKTHYLNISMKVCI